MSIQPHPLGGCIRLYDSGPQWHVNGTHQPLSLRTDANPTINASGDLEFLVADEAVAVAGIVVGVDESLAARGVSCGPSGGISATSIRFHHDDHGRLNLNDPADYAVISGEVCNVWLTGHIFVDVPPPPEPEPEPEPEPPGPDDVTWDIFDAWIQGMTPHRLDVLRSLATILAGEGPGSCCCGTTDPDPEPEPEEHPEEP